MTWDSVVLNIKEFFNQPVVVIVTSIASTVVGAIAIISKTSFGKRAIRRMKEQIKEIREKVDLSHQTVEDVKELAYDKIDSLKAEYECKLKVLVSQYDFFVDGVFSVLELYPNIKIKEAVSKLRAEYEVRREEIKKVVGWAYNDVEEYINEKRSELDEYIVRAKALIDELTAAAVEENSHEEREEAKDTIPTLQTV